MRSAFLLILIALQSSVLMSQPNDFNMFNNGIDIGNPKLQGLSTYEPKTQTYSLSGAGENMWFDKDQFHFLFRKIEGDFIIRATVRFEGEGSHEHRKIGIMAREDLTSGSRHANGSVHGDGLTTLHYRDSSDGNTNESKLFSFDPTEIELERKGNTFIFSAARFGENYKSVQKQLTINSELYVGLFICSHDPDVIEKAEFSNVRVVLPPKSDHVAYEDYLGSRLEVMDVFTGERTLLHEQPNSMQAPNWTPDNKKLIWAEEGLLKYYNLNDGTLGTLNTGFATNNNNDHVLSFDGSMMAISNHMGDDGISTIFTLPADGSDNPTQITKTENGHSYLHSWSPDGKKLVFTGRRNDKYDIWEVDVETKEEYPLTDTPYLDDGSEYTPDGKYIYFNSVRTGTMQIWRMNPDGSDQTQITFDEYNDWFPHPSPDGKWIIYLSYPVDMDPSSHPFYKKVYLRLMPATGGVPRTIAYLFGGQGTINVPSWSPDSKKVSFISNSYVLE